MAKKKVLCIMGKSGVGKSSLISKICNDKCFHYIKSKTTRNIRDYDPNDKDTHTFTNSKEFFDDIVNSRVLATYYSPTDGYVNWTSDDLILDNKINVLAIDPIAFVDIANRYNDRYDLYGIYLDLNEDIRRERLFKRGDIIKDESWLDSSWIKKSSIPDYYYSIIDNNKNIDEQTNFVLNVILNNAGWGNV